MTSAQYINPSDSRIAPGVVSAFAVDMIDWKSFDNEHYECLLVFEPAHLVSVFST